MRREALIAVANAKTQRIATPSFTPLDDQLKSRFIDNAEPIIQRKISNCTCLMPIASVPRSTHGTTAPIAPVTFNDEIALIGLDRPLSIAAPDGR